ncbi:MAG: tagaturonate epimerase family protein [Phycisphaerales bacterium]
MSTAKHPVPLGLSPSFGFGDRTGLATPGHVKAMQQAGGGILPIFPQQSIREMARTHRSPRQVMDDAMNGMTAAGWTGPTGADADHLKTPDDVNRTAAVGFTFFTIDPSGHVDAHADNYSADDLRTQFTAVRGEIAWYDHYLGKSVQLDSGSTVQLDEQAVMRCAVKYGRAINAAVELARYIKQVNEQAGRDYEIELSVDETEQPTTLAEHWIIADQCLRGGMKLVSLAPRFIGDFEKGVDYKGDPRKLEASLRDHAEIAAKLGPYKLSLHSGSDKLSMYTAFARATKGLFHVKTAGTSYLEALRVVAIHEPRLFRRVIDFARARYDADKATYHVSATVAGTPAPKDIADNHKLEQLYLECWDDVPAGKGFTSPGRQILHCTFGSTLTDPTLGKAVRQMLEAHPDTYTEVLAVHFAKHLESLKAGL